MKQINVKKLLLPNLPYVFIALFATKLGQAARLAPGADFSQKALHIMEGFAAAFQSALPSFHPIDLCVGVAAALLIRLAVYVKGKNARKFRKNIEYGSARWGNAEDINTKTRTIRTSRRKRRTRMHDHVHQKPAGAADDAAPLSGKRGNAAHPCPGGAFLLRLFPLRHRLPPSLLP